MSNSELALAAMHRLCKKAGAERVSGSAAKELAKVLEDVGVKIARDAIGYGMHAGRKTVKGGWPHDHFEWFFERRFSLLFPFASLILK